MTSGSIISLRDTDKSRYFGRTKLNNCFFFSYFSKSLSDSSGKRSAHFHTSVVTITHGQNIICSKTHLDGIVHEQTIIFYVVCRSRGELSADEKEESMHRMIIMF